MNTTEKYQNHMDADWLEQIQEYVKRAKIRKEKKETLRKSEFPFMSMAIQQLAHAVITVIPAVGSNGALLESINNNVYSAFAPQPVSGEATLSGKCPIGESFYELAWFQREFDTPRADTGMLLWDYYFNYAKAPEQEPRPLMNAIKYLRYLYPQIHTEQGRPEVPVKEFKKNSTPVIKILSQQQYTVETPAGLTATIQLHELPNYPEIQEAIEDLVKSRLSERGCDPASVKKAYRVLVDKLVNVRKLLSEVQLKMSDSVFDFYLWNSNNSQKNYSGLSVLAAENGTYVLDNPGLRLEVNYNYHGLDLLDLTEFKIGLSYTRSSYSRVDYLSFSIVQTDDECQLVIENDNNHIVGEFSFIHSDAMVGEKIFEASLYLVGEIDKIATALDTKTEELRIYLEQQLPKDSTE